MSNVIHVNQQQFESEVLESNLPVVIDFYADWCPPCRALGPIIDRLAEEFSGRIKFIKINSDEEPELAKRFQVTGLPTLVFVRQGKVEGQAAGLPQEDALRSDLARWVEVENVSTQ